MDRAQKSPRELHSGTIAFFAVGTLAVLIILGSLALQLATAEGEAEPAASAVKPGSATIRLPAAGYATDVVAVPDSLAAGLVGTLQADPALSDTLQWLLTRVHVLFEPYSADVNAEMIPYLADIITVVNQRDNLLYRLEIYEPDVVLARRRAQTLNDVLRLNVLEPAALQITGQEGSHTILVHVTS
jgi:hypothetical protein